MFLVSPLRRYSSCFIRKHVDAEGERFCSYRQVKGVRMVLLLGIPAMFGLIVLAKPMLMVLFMRGEVFSP
ncbi:hypothetical protein O9993_07730 [Vibrio lentus]|nr:hypothetical protein [Vibrio lentus]